MKNNKEVKIKVKKYVILSGVVLFAVSTVFASDRYSELLKEGTEAVNAGESQKAETVFSGLIENDPARPEAYFAMAVMYISKGDPKTAKKYLIESLEKESGYAQSYYLLGRVSEKLQEYDDAMRYYLKYIELEPDSPRNDKIRKRIDFLRERKETL
ncbi:MAG: tetratricopeptide repeat protein [Elusimicrobiota bacterium]